MVDLNDMVIFAKVAELEGISPAARALNMPKSKVSRRMVMLEEELGTRLLERSTRSVHITEAGKLYLQHCKRVVEEAGNAVESLNQLAEAPRGYLRISASVTTGQQLIAPHIGEFLRLYPDIEIELDLSNRRVDMIAEGFDLVVRVGRLHDSTLISKILGKSRARLYASSQYLANYGEPATLQELAHHKTLVMTDTTQAYRWMLENHDGIKESINITPIVSANDLTTIQKISIDGGGIALLPDYLVKKYVKSDALKVLLPKWRSPIIPYYVLYPSHQGLMRKARVWIDFLSERLNILNV